MATKAPTVPGMTFTGKGIKSTAAGGYVPIFELDSFQESLEGWNLRARCHRDGDMRPYEAAREAWYAARRRAKSEGLRIAGIYPFTVTGFARERHAGNDSLPPCNVAVLTVEINAGRRLGRLSVEHRLPLHSTQERQLYNFLASVGMVEQGGRVHLNWAQIIGRHGACEVGSRSETDLTGCEILRFLRSKI